MYIIYIYIYIYINIYTYNTLLHSTPLCNTSFAETLDSGHICDSTFIN